MIYGVSVAATVVTALLLFNYFYKTTEDFLGALKFLVYPFVVVFQYQTRENTSKALRLYSYVSTCAAAGAVTFVLLSQIMHKPMLALLSR